MISVISVVMKARSRREPINRPLTAPSAAPQIKVATITAGTGQSSTLRQNSAQKSHSANIEPTERSMPPTMTTSAMPSTMKPISPACRPVSARPPGDRKPGIERDSRMVMIRSTMTGIAVSVQRLDRISPSRWSGQYRYRKRSSASCIGGLEQEEDDREGRRVGCGPGGDANGSAARQCGESACYFLRSLRFQQAVSLPALSLVIGISVVYIEPFTDPGLTPEDTSH